MTDRTQGLVHLEDADTRRGPNTRMWLNAGAVTLGVGAALVAGAAVASADTGPESGPSTGQSASSRLNSHVASSTPAKSRSTHSVAAKPTAATRNAAATNASASIDAITVPSTPAPAFASSRTPSAAALAAASTTAAATTQPVALATPTPNNILQGLEEFGHNVYLTVADQITGVENNLAVLGEDLLTVLGISRETITGSGIYGNPTQNKQYYVPMSDYETAPLAAVAMAYGQLTHTAPDLPGFTAAARTTPSLAQPGYKVWNGPGDYVIQSDSYELLQDKNVRVITSNYLNDQQSKAIYDLSAGLSDPTKVMIAAIIGPVGQTDPQAKQVIVLGLDTARNIVTINDPTQSTGQGLEMTVGDFAKQWSAENYQLVTTQLAASSSTPLPEPATKLVWSLPAPNEIGQALQAGLTNIATLVVHQIDGAATNLGVLANDLGYTFGTNDPNIAPPAPQSIEYGNYTKNKPYYYYQGDYPSCVLMATAAIIGQLRGGPVPADLGQQVLTQAETTPSGVLVDQMMYYPDGTDTPGSHWGTYTADAVKLLNMNGMNADWTTFLKSQGGVALETMNAALNQNQGVIVFVSSNMIQNAYTRKYFGKTWRNPGSNGPVSDHAVVVISVDITKDVVYINDSAWENGQGLPIPLDQFLAAWKYSSYRLITAKKAA